MTMRHRMWIMAIGLAAALAVWFAMRAVENWQFHTELRRAQRDMSARRFASARRVWPGWRSAGPAGAKSSIRLALAR